MSDKEKISTSPLPGFMELTPADQIKFNEILDIIRNSYEKFGFIPVDTPILEKAETLLAKAGGETEKQIYSFKKGDANLAMRFDLTVPLARYVAEHYRDLTFPFRRYAIGKVYRGEKSQAGRFREFYQCDIDIIGDENLDISFDAEIPAVISSIFTELGFKFTIRVNNRKLFNGLFNGLEISKNTEKVMQSIDRMEKIGKEAVRRELEEINLEKETIDKIFSFIEISGSSEEIISSLKNLNIQEEQFNSGIAELSEVVKLMKQFGISEDNFMIDLKIARGLDYYTGTVYETKLDEYPEIGSVCSGGRYENLASTYSNKNLPGVGISIGLTRLFDQLKRRGLILGESATPTKVLIMPMTEDISTSLKLATNLRKKNISTEISFNYQEKMKKRLNYANKLNIPYVVFIGEKEIENNFFTLKDFKTGEQTEIIFEELLEKICNKK